MGGIWMDGANWGDVLNTHGWDLGRGHPPPTYILHNTIVGNGPQLRTVDLTYFGENSDGTFVNNLVAQFGDGVGPINWLETMGASVDPAVHVDSVRNNLFWREWGDVLFNNYAGWTNGVTTLDKFGWSTWANTLGGTGVNANPLFLDENIGAFGPPPVQGDQGALRGYLQSDSPAINQGEDIQALVESFGLPWTDINGNPRDSTPDIGAYQYIDG